MVKMERLIKNWKFIFVLALFLLCGVLYVHLLLQQIEPPSKEWSRSVLVDEVSDLSVGNSSRTRVTTVPIPSENRFIIFWNTRNSIKYVSVDKYGVKGEIKSINIKLGEPSVLKAVLNKDKINVYGLESGTLKKYSFNYKAEEFKFVKVVATGVNSFITNNDNLFLAGDNYIRLIENNGRNKLINSIGAEVIDAIQRDDGIYKIAFIKSDIKGTLHIKYEELNPKNNQTRIYEIGKQVSSSNEIQSADNIVICNENNKIYIMVPRKSLAGKDTCRRPPKSTDTSTMLYSFDNKNIKNVKEDYLQEINGFNPNPVFIDNNSKEISFLASIVAIKGNKTDVINIRKYILKNGHIHPVEFLTKTNDISSNPYWFKLGNSAYLEWEDITGTSTKIMYASTNRKLIDTAGKMKMEEAVNVFLDTLMALGFGLSYLLIIFSCIILPTLILAIIVSFFFMNWVESNNRIATFAAISVHIIAELIMTACTILKNPLVLALTPGFMHSSAIMYGSVILIGMISYYCVKLKYKNEKLDKSFINQYIFFAIINMILYALLFFPYYYI